MVAIIWLNYSTSSTEIKVHLLKLKRNSLVHYFNNASSYLSINKVNIIIII